MLIKEMLQKSEKVYLARKLSTPGNDYRQVPGKVMGTNMLMFDSFKTARDK